MSWLGLCVLCVYIYFLLSSGNKHIENDEPRDYIDA